MRFKHNNIDIDVLDNGTFTAKLNGVEITAPSLPAMKKKLDKTQPFKPFDAFFINYGDVVVDVTIVGVKKDRGYSRFSWRTQDGRTLNNVWRDTPKARAALKKYQEAVAKHAKIKDENEKLEEKLRDAIGEQVSPEDLPA